MVRGNSRRGTSRRVSGRGRSNIANLARIVSRLSKQEPYRVKCPQDPLPYRPGIMIEKYVHMDIVSAKSGGFDWGTPVGPAKWQVSEGSLSPVSVEITRGHIQELVGGQWFGTANITQSFHLFESFALVKACLWSPSNPATGYGTVRMSILPPDLAVDSESVKGDKVMANPTPVFIDAGSPSTRGRISVSVPQPIWWAPSIDSDHSYKDVLIKVWLGDNSHESSTAGETLGQIAMLVRCVSGVTKT